MLEAAGGALGAQRDTTTPWPTFTSRLLCAFCICTTTTTVCAPTTRTDAPHRLVSTVPVPRGLPSAARVCAAPWLSTRSRAYVYAFWSPPESISAAIVPLRASGCEASCCGRRPAITAGAVRGATRSVLLDDASRRRDHAVLLMMISQPAKAVVSSEAFWQPLPTQAKRGAPLPHLILFV